MKYLIISRKTKYGWDIHAPALPGCHSQGKLKKEALENIKDAISGYLAVLKEDGDQIPVESVEHIAATVSVSFA